MNALLKLTLINIVLSLVSALALVYFFLAIAFTDDPRWNPTNFYTAFGCNSPYLILVGQFVAIVTSLIVYLFNRYTVARNIAIIVPLLTILLVVFLLSL